MHQRSDIFTTHHLFQVTIGIHVEDNDRKIVFLTHRGGCQVHHFETARIDLVVCEFRELGGRRILFRIGSIDTIYTSSFQHHIRFDLDTTQG